MAERLLSNYLPVPELQTPRVLLFQFPLGSFSGAADCDSDMEEPRESYDSAKMRQATTSSDQKVP